MKRVSVSVFLVAVLLLGSSVISYGLTFGDNLLVNGGFENGLGGWTSDYGYQRSANPSAHGGNSYLGNKSDKSLTYQVVDLINLGFYAYDLDASSISVLLGGWQAGYQNQTDRGMIEYYFYSSYTDEENYEDVYSGSLGWVSTDSTWEDKFLTMILPANTRFIGFNFVSVRGEGTNNDGYLDDAYIVLSRAATPAPEPSTIPFFWGSGLSGLPGLAERN